MNKNETVQKNKSQEHNANYFYDAKTGEFLYSTPIEYDGFGNEVQYYNASKVAPKQATTRNANTVAVYKKTEEQWEHIEDHRGKQGFVNGKAVVIEELGALPAGFTDTPPELVQTLEEQQEEVHIKRNYLLQDTDWTQLQDAPLTEEEKGKWKAYRQSLRDITKHELWGTEPQKIEIEEKI